MIERAFEILTNKLEKMDLEDRQERDKERKQKLDEYNKNILESKDPIERVKWLQLAADIGDGSAQNNLGVAYVTGRGVPKDEKTAAEFFKLAATQNIVEAKHSLGQCLHSGIGVEKDEKQGMELFISAANQGFAPSQYKLGVIFSSGLGVEKDDNAGFNWFKKAADQGHADAQFKLAIYYTIKKDLVEETNWLKRAADQGHAQAQSGLGAYYGNGSIVPKSIEKAVELFKLAAPKDSGAQHNLGNCLFWGRGVEKDQKQAIELFQKAADQGRHQSQYFLGFIYLNGLGGVEKDGNKAFHWFSKVAAQGYPSGKAALGICYENGYGVKKDVKRALRYYKQATAEGDGLAAFKLFLFYIKGTEKNREQAKKYLLLAQEGNFPKIKYSASLLFLANTKPTPIATFLKDIEIYVFKRTLSAFQVDNNDLAYKKRFASINPECLKVLHEYIVFMKESAITPEDANTMIRNSINAFDSDMDEENARKVVKQTIMKIFEEGLTLSTKLDNDSIKSHVRR